MTMQALIDHILAGERLSGEDFLTTAVRTPGVV